MHKIILLFKKEMLDAVRDSWTFYVSVIMPFLLYPMLFIVMGFFMRSEILKEAKLVYKIGIINPSTIPGLISCITDTMRFDIIEGNEPLMMFRKDKVKIVLETKNKNKLVVFYDGADKGSQSALKRIDKLLSTYQDSIIKMHIIEKGLSEEILKPLAIEKENIAPAKKMGGFWLGILIPYMLIIVAFQGALRSAIDITAGEKERKTIETLLVTDIKRGEIVIGKCLTSFVLALLATISGLLGLVITMQCGFSILSQIGKTFGSTIPWLSCLVMLVIMLPILWFFSSLLIAIGSASRSVNQATMYGTYCLIAVILLAIFSIVRMTEPGRIIFFIPVINTAIIQQQILVAEVKTLDLFITLGSSIIYALIAYLFAKHNFEKEEILLRS